MPVERIDIAQFLEFSTQHAVFDVRSPGEYQHAHIPGAISLPLFSDEERKIVGTAYKQESREQAIKLGLDFFGKKMRCIVETVEDAVSGWSKDSVRHTEPAPASNKSVIIHCWRGGMRSDAIAWLLALYGFHVYVLHGGYKSFRHFVLDLFREDFNFRVLGGYTGSGKTELLHELKRRGERVIDLEGIASHKGSAFGNIGMPPQPSQEMFENLLAHELYMIRQQSSVNTPKELPIWIEDESQRLGHVNLPNALYATMRNSPVYFLEIPFEERLNHIVGEYGCLDRQRVKDAVVRLSRKLGPQHAKTILQHLNAEEIADAFRILLGYYDKFYFKTLHNRIHLDSLLQVVECKSVTVENAQLLVPASAYAREEV